MIYITGDTHSDFRRFDISIFPEQKEMTKEDYCIIAGDFGGVWYQIYDRRHRRIEDRKLNELDRRPYTTLFVPGNHENYARLMSDEFPVKEWKGGIVKEIRPSVLMLMRGEMYDLDGVTIYTFGGAQSDDITDGLLDGTDPDWLRQALQLEREGKYLYRIKGISWWEEELPSEEEMQHGLDVLTQHGWKADIVITHCAPTAIQEMLGYHSNDVLTRYLEEIRIKLDYKRWFFGHYHRNCQVTAKDIVLYEQMVRIADFDDGYDQ